MTNLKEVFEIAIEKKYSFNNKLESLKALYEKANWSGHTNTVSVELSFLRTRLGSALNLGLISQEYYVRFVESIRELTDLNEIKYAAFLRAGK